MLSISDRIDLHIEVSNVSYDDLVSDINEESSAAVKERVNNARNIQLQRFKSADIYSNAQMNNSMMSRFCKLDAKSDDILRVAFKRLGFSARAYHRIIKVSRTIADLADSENIQPTHISEAIGYRSLDREFFK